MSVKLSGLLEFLSSFSQRAKNYRYASELRVLSFMCIVFGLSLLLNSGFEKRSNKEKGQRFTFNVIINAIFFEIESARLSWLTEIEQK